MYQIPHLELHNRLHDFLVSLQDLMGFPGLLGRPSECPHRPTASPYFNIDFFLISGFVLNGLAGFKVQLQLMQHHRTGSLGLP